MAEDFRAKVTAELDTAEAESKLNAFLNEKRKLKIDVEVNQDSAKKMASSIEKGIKDTKIDTSGISKQLAGSFNITDKNVISKLQSQMDKMISSLGKTWNGKDFDFGKASGFYSGMDSMVNTVMKNAKIVEGATGSYDAFFNYFKDKKIYVSDELKKAMGEDTYKELLQNNIGKIVRDASKGISIDSLWGEMRDLFPEHFSDNITNQVDQIVHAFDVLHQARADVGQVTTAQNMTAEQLTGISDSAAEQVVAIAAKLKESLQSNIMGASEAAKTTIDLDVNVNTDKISSDIRSAVENAGNQAEGALKVNMEVNEEQLVSKIREALSSLATGEEPVKVNLQVNKESLQEDLNLALNEMDLPVHFKIDTEEIESQIRAAVESIQDMEIDLRVNTRDIQNDVDTAVNGATETPEIHVPEVDSSGLAQMQQALNGVNAAGIRGQSVFKSLGGSFREAFSAYSLANMMQDGLYKIVDAGKKAVSTVKEFDDLKTNLAMVTGKDKTYTEDLMQSYNELGQEIGSITSDVAESANTWLRQGRSMADTNQLIKDSMVLSKDAQMSSEDAAQVLTSTLNGFKLGADQASRINDILTSIDLKSASDAGGIGTSLQKVASQANNVGMSLEKTAAIIATIKDVTQGSDETIGKSKNKDINAIKAQIAALEGTTNAAAKAKLEQLKADLAEKEEDLEDTKHDHEIDLISKGYDNLTDQADKALDSTLNAVKSNSQMQTAVIEEMLKTTKQKYKDAYAEINQIIADTGLKVSDQFQNNIKDSNLKNEQTDKKKADKTFTGIKDTKVSGSTGTGSTAADKVIRNAATDAQDKTLKKLSLSPKSVVVNVGKTATVKVSFSPSTAVNKNFNCTASAKGIVKITQTADSITLKGLKTGKTVIKVQGAGGYCKAVSLNVSVLKDATKNSKIVNSTAKSKKYSLTTEEKNRVLNMSTGQNANTVKANTKKEAELKKWYKALPTYTGGDAEIEKLKDPIVKHFAKKGKKASNANIIKAASILGYKDAKNVSKWDTKKKNAMVKKLQTFGFSKGGVIRNLIPATMGTLLGDAIMKNGDTGFIGAKPGETVLTQDFTKLLKPTTATMQEFTEVMQKAGTPSVKETPVRQEVTMNNEYQFVINGVDVNDMSELKKVIRGELDKHDKQLAKEFKKFR